jgi:hypothetical protein
LSTNGKLLSRLNEEDGLIAKKKTKKKVIVLAIIGL